MAIWLCINYPKQWPVRDRSANGFFTPQHRTHSLDAAYSYERSSVVCLSVCRSAGHECEPCKKRMYRSRCRLKCCSLGQTQGTTYSMRCKSPDGKKHKKDKERHARSGIYSMRLTRGRVARSDAAYSPPLLWLLADITPGKIYLHLRTGQKCKRAGWQRWNLYLNRCVAMSVLQVGPWSADCCGAVATPHIRTDFSIL